MCKPVRRKFGLVLGHGQVISNDQVRGDFVLALKLERFGCEALALVPRDLDLEANRYQSCERDLC